MICDETVYGEQKKLLICVIGLCLLCCVGTAVFLGVGVVRMEKEIRKSGIVVDVLVRWNGNWYTYAQVRTSREGEEKKGRVQWYVEIKGTYRGTEHRRKVGVSQEVYGVAKECMGLSLEEVYMRLLVKKVRSVVDEKGKQ